MLLKIGETVRRLRTERGITQEQLAVFLGVTPQAVSRWELAIGYPDVELLPTIAEYFGVTTDELFGREQADREALRREIYVAMRSNANVGEDNEETVRTAREYVAAFPTDEKIQKNLADSICRAYMWEETPDLNRLAEAEKRYLTLAETTRDVDFRNEVLCCLGSLYAVGYKEPGKLEEVLRQLPAMRFCREASASRLAKTYGGDVRTAQAYLETLTDALGEALVGYVVDWLPNGAERWDEKVGLLERAEALYRWVFGDELLVYGVRVGYIRRVIATYRLAQGRYDEALTALERMCEAVEAYERVGAGDRFRSPFADGLQPEVPVAAAHNEAWWTLEKLQQARYDPVRETERFRAVVDRLNAVAK